MRKPPEAEASAGLRDFLQSAKGNRSRLATAESSEAEQSSESEAAPSSTESLAGGEALMTEQPLAVAPRPTTVKRVRLRERARKPTPLATERNVRKGYLLDKGLAKRFKLSTVTEDTTMNQVVIDGIQRWLKEAEAGNVKPFPKRSWTDETSVASRKYEISEQIFRRFKLEATRHDVPMNEVILQEIERWIDQTSV